MTKYNKDSLDWPYLIQSGAVTLDEAIRGGFRPNYDPGDDTWNWIDPNGDQQYRPAGRRITT